MEITNLWTQISASGAIVQKLGSQSVSIAYSATSPAGNIERFSLVNNHVSVFPAVTGKLLWAKTPSGTASITVEDLAE